MKWKKAAGVIAMNEVRFGTIFKLFLPLALASWITMISAPLINAGIVRVANPPEAALAAYAVARNLIWLFSPFNVMVPNAFLVLVKDETTLIKYRNFLIILSGAVLGFGLLVVLTPLWQVLLRDLMGLTLALAQTTRQALLVLLLSPLFTMWRGFTQGALIQRHQTKYLLAGGVAHFVILLLGVLAGRFVTLIAGAVYGAILFVVSSAADATCIHWLAKLTKPGAERDVESVASSKSETGIGDSGLTFTRIFIFFFPLMLTTWVMAASRTVINAGLARTLQPEIALASFSVAVGLVFAFESPTFVMRHTTLAFDDRPSTLKRLALFTLIVGTMMTLAILIISVTPAINVILRDLIGVTGAVFSQSVVSVQILSITLLILAWRQFNYALLMRVQKTRTIGFSAVMRFVFLTVSIFVGLRLWPDIPGAYLAAVVYACGFVVETVIVHYYAILRPKRA
jgi:hypothetical protein